MLNRSGIVPLPYAGASLLFSWIYLLFYANSAGIEAAAPVSLYSAPYAISATCMMATMAIIAFSPISSAEVCSRVFSRASCPNNGSSPIAAWDSKAQSAAFPL